MRLSGVPVGVEEPHLDRLADLIGDETEDLSVALVERARR